MNDTPRFHSAMADGINGDPTSTITTSQEAPPKNVNSSENSDSDDSYHFRSQSSLDQEDRGFREKPDCPLGLPVQAKHATARRRSITAKVLDFLHLSKDCPTSYENSCIDQFIRSVGKPSSLQLEAFNDTS